jgi:hypothetical protein
MSNSVIIVSDSHIPIWEALEQQITKHLVSHSWLSICVQSYTILRMKVHFYVNCSERSQSTAQGVACYEDFST